MQFYICALKTMDNAYELLYNVYKFMSHIEYFSTNVCKTRALLNNSDS
jgi:hypothetical protein